MVFSEVFMICIKYRKTWKDVQFDAEHRCMKTVFCMFPSQLGEHAAPSAHADEMNVLNGM